MSTPTTSTGPTPPSGTSNPVSLRGWFASIIDWIKALVPAGATAYDTGWVQLSSTGVTIFARRTGRTVTVTVTGGQSIPSLGKVIIATANIIPATMRPARDMVGIVELRWLQNGVGTVTVDTGGTVWVWNPTSSANSSWYGSITYVM